MRMNVTFREGDVKLNTGLRSGTNEISSAFRDVQIMHIERPKYNGPVVITPTQDTQVLDMAGKYTDSNITVNPIPSNYGLITWDGSILTVS